METIKTYKKIEKKLFEVGFDEFYQAGSKNKFCPLNIVATSKVLNKQFWVCVDGGYRTKDTFHITYRDLDNTKATSTRINCKNQTEVVEKLNAIQNEIMEANEKEVNSIDIVEQIKTESQEFIDSINKKNINIKSLSNMELVKAYKEEKQNFMNAIEGTPEELEADKIYTELSKELNDRNLDLRDYQEESNNNNKENSGMTNMTMKETIRKILVRATNKGNIKTIAEVKYFINSDNNILMKIPLRSQKGNARITIFQDGSSTVGQFGKDFRQVDVNISQDIKHVIYKVFIDEVYKYTYEDFGEDKAIDRIKSQLKDKEYTLLQVI